jgi:ferritin-like metal-binding protein YciE
LVKALPKLAKAASAPKLQQALTEHLEVTKQHVTRLEQIFESMGMKPKSKACAGMKGLVTEGGELTHEKGSENLLDMALIGAAQRVEHYEIAAYGTARAFAERLGNDEAVDLLQKTLDEEKEADKTLTQISENLLKALPASGAQKEGRKTRSSSGH